jgi:hypothetical protein
VIILKGNKEWQLLKEKKKKWKQLLCNAIEQGRKMNLAKNI